MNIVFKGINLARPFLLSCLDLESTLEEFLPTFFLKTLSLALSLIRSLKDSESLFKVSNRLMP